MAVLLDRVDSVLLTSVVRRCPDCDGDRIFVSPDCPQGVTDDGCPPADFACTDCGAALFVDPLLFDYAGSNETGRRSA